MKHRTSAVAHTGTPPFLSGKAATLTWLALTLATVAAWWLADTELSAAASPQASAGGHGAIIALAVLKMYLVLAIFMGLLGAPRVWHAYGAALLLLMGGLMGWLVVGL